MSRVLAENDADAAIRLAMSHDLLPDSDANQFHPSIGEIAAAVLDRPLGVSDERP